MSLLLLQQNRSNNYDFNNLSPGQLWVQSIVARPLLIWTLSYLSQLLYLGTFYPDDAPCQALMDQQAKLRVKINPTVMLVLQKHKVRSVMSVGPESLPIVD